MNDGLFYFKVRKKINIVFFRIFNNAILFRTYYLVGKVNFRFANFLKFNLVTALSDF